MQHAFQVVERTRAATLPVLATASDVREVVQLLKKKPEGITIVEASNAVRKRLFDPRKVAAYEAWGILAKSGDRMKLSRLGREFANTLEPEAQVYRMILDNTPPYRAVLEWVYQEDLDLVTFEDIVGYWEEHFPEALLQGEKTTEGQVVSFLHLCHAGETGEATVGRKGQPSRLRVDHNELAAYIEGTPRQISNPVCEEDDSRLEVRRPAALGAAVPKSSMRVLISKPGDSGLVGSVQDALLLAGIDSEVVERETDCNQLVPDRMLRAMRRCDAGIIILSHADCDLDGAGKKVLNQETLIEIAGALVHFARRLVILRYKEVPMPFNLRDLSNHELESDELTWEAGLRLIKSVQTFKSSARLDSRGELV